MPRPLKNSKGSAIVWALLVLAMLSVLIVTALTISFSYLQRTRTGVDAQQCYFTARSVAEAVAQRIINDPGCGLLPAEGAEDITDNDVAASFPADAAGMADECAVSISRTGKSAATVTAAVTLRESQYTYTVNLSADTMILPQFEGGMYLKQVSTHNAYSGTNTSPFKSIDGDLYISGDGVNYIDFPVNGNVFAPNATVVITCKDGSGGEGAMGGVTGAVFARSVQYVTGGSSQRYMPIMCVTPSGGEQEGFDDIVTEHVYLSDADFAVLFNSTDGKLYKPYPYAVEAPESGAASCGAGEHAVYVYDTGWLGKGVSIDRVTLLPQFNSYDVALTAGGETILTVSNNIPGNEVPELRFFTADAADGCVIKTLYLGKLRNKKWEGVDAKFYIKGASETLTLSDAAVSTEHLEIIGGEDSVLALDTTASFNVTDTSSPFNVGQITGRKDQITVKRSTGEQPYLVVQLGWRIAASEEG